MKHDIGSGYNTIEALTALSRTADTYNSEAVDTAKAQSVQFVLSCGVFATSLAAQVQYSDDDSTYTDEPDGNAGNDVSASLSDVGMLVVNVPNPRARYVRLAVTNGGTCVFSVVAVSGPKLNVEPAATT